MEPQGGALMEAFQRRQGGGGGGPVPQGPTPAPQGGGAGGPQSGGQGGPQSMSQGGIDQLQKSAPGEAEIIIKALIQRLKSLGEKGQ